MISRIQRKGSNGMQLIKIDSTSLLITFAVSFFVFLTGCSSASTQDQEIIDREEPVVAMPGNAPASATSVSEGPCKIEDETGVKVCVTSQEPAMNCRKSTKDQSIYKTCQVEVSYGIENESELPVRVQAECQAGLEYKSKYGWKENSKTDSYRYTLNPKETKSRTFYFDSKFNRHRKVREVKLGPIECSIISIASANPDSSAIDVSEGVCKVEAATGVKVCVKALEPVLNCRKSPEGSTYKACQVAVSYKLQNESERHTSVQIECQAGFEYNGKSGWEENSKTDSYSYTLSANETASRSFNFESKFNWLSKVTEVKMGSADCEIVSVYVY
jgi:hypothetical protein